jgi:4-hydroxymandelate oxidase
VTRAVCVDDYEALARDRLAGHVYSYLSSGGADEITLRRNRTAFDSLLLATRVLRDTRAIDTRCRLLGSELASPVLLAPAALHKLVCDEGELAAARVAMEAESLFVLSTLASLPIADVGAVAGGRMWMQMYIQRDRGKTLDIVRRAEDAGCTALCLTVDTPCAPARYREQRAPLQTGEVRPVNVLADGESWGTARARSVFENLLDPSVTWDDIGWLREHTRLPVVLKGILHPADARLATEAGVAAIIVSNHGGRNLDTTPATIEALPYVAHAVAGRIPVLLDGGVRRGTDIIKALALGAGAVLLARPYLYALACDGAQGIRDLLALLRDELVVAMRLCGVCSLEEITGDVLWQPRTFDMGDP